MSDNSPTILVLGAGVAGMAAALELSRSGFTVHVAEKQEKVGGQAAKWACMATEGCRFCSACLESELERDFLSDKRITLHLKTQLKTAIKTDNGYKVELEGESSEKLEVARIILANGITTFNPEELESLHYREFDKVITTADLNNIMVEEKLADYLSFGEETKIGFLQCIGSRDQVRGRDYCSQVCCKTAIRHANKLASIFKKAQITVFHMDLQRIGKQFRSMVTENKRVKLIQGVPAEILRSEENGKLKIFREDNSGQRVADEFDLLVLSVGMRPSTEMNELAEILKIQPNSWGFIGGEEVKQPENIHAAGASKGPMDILSSITDGKLVASEITEQLKPLANENKKTIAVIGGGFEAQKCAEFLAGKNYNILGLHTDRKPDSTEKINWIPSSKLVAVDGFKGNYRITYKQGEGYTTETVNDIVVARGIERASGNIWEDLGDKVQNLHELKEAKDSDLPQTIAFLLGYHGPEDKTMSRSAMKLAGELCKTGKNIIVLFETMLVHGMYGQRLYDETRKSGARLIRFDSKNKPALSLSGDKVSVSVKDPTLPNLELEMDCDLLIVPNKVEPTGDTEELATILRQMRDAEGYLQSANVRHRLIQSPRKGLYFIGSCHDECDLDDFDTELKLLANLLQRKDDNTVTEAAEINEKKCARCLTCYRLCSHAAITLRDEKQPVVNPDVCIACGLCATCCPGSAIELKTLPKAETSKDKTVIFACERSASLAIDKARNMGVNIDDNVEIVTISCAGSMGVEQMLAPLLNGATKVAVTGCHDGNCRSMYGSHVAESRVQSAINNTGLNNGELSFFPIAANQPLRVKAMLDDLSKKGEEVQHD